MGMVVVVRIVTIIQKIVTRIIPKAENIGAEEVVIVAPVKDHNDHKDLKDQEKRLLLIVVKIEIENVTEITMALIMDVIEITEILIMIEIVFGKENETVIEIVIVFETMIGTVMIGTVVIATEIGIEEVGIDITDQREIDAIE